MPLRLALAQLAAVDVAVPALNAVPSARAEGLRDPRRYDSSLWSVRRREVGRDGLELFERGS